MNRIMIAGSSSGCGKTTITCGILQCFINKGIKVSSFKCGPDYIDPMFHEQVIGIPSRNLDGFFCDNNILRYLLNQNGEKQDISVLEGVMGLYDGIGFTDKASSYMIAKETKTPIILILNCRGMSYSIKAVLKGFLEMQSDDNLIVGVIFNELSVTLYKEAAKMAEFFGITALGYLPVLQEGTFKSRHLGLITDTKLKEQKEQLLMLAKQVEKTIDLDRIIQLSKLAEELDSYIPKWKKNNTTQRLENPLRIAVAKDLAFNFIYRDNIECLVSMGCEICYFSPLFDKELPEKVSGLILSGGYPELYTKQLSENTQLRGQIKQAILNGLPCIAECGGFLYIHKQLEDIDKKSYPMVGVISGTGRKNTKMGHFGYINLYAKYDNLLCKKGEKLPAHEFHYWQSDNEGSDFITEKASGKSTWDCAYAKNNLYAGFPHFYFYGCPLIAKNFVERCKEYEHNRVDR